MTTEKRLIDANKIRDKAIPLEGLDGDGIPYAIMAVPVDAIEDAPTVDAVEVVHGRWLVDEYDSGEMGDYAAYVEVHCSECGYGLGAESGQYGWRDGDPFPLHFCPNCGAKMDLEEP